MTQVIWKFEIRLQGEPQTIEMPQGATILDVQVQNGHPQLWALVDHSASLQRRTFQIHGTGHPFSAESMQFVRTFQMPPFVWHLFEAV